MRRWIVLAGLALLLLTGAWVGVSTQRRAPRNEHQTLTEASARSENAASLQTGPQQETPSEAEETGIAREALSAVTAAEPQPRTGTLRVRVVSAETSTPIAGIGVFLGSSFGPPVEASDSASGTSTFLTTDAEGRVAFEVPIGERTDLKVNSDRRMDIGHAVLEIGAFVDGETRNVTIPVPTQPVDWFGRIRDAATGAPIAGALVERVEGDLRDARDAETALTDSGGTVRLAYTAWEESFARVQHDGYATGYVRLLDGHSGPDDACVVLLRAAAGVDVLVSDHAGRPRSDVLVRISCEQEDIVQEGWFAFDRQRPAWEARTDSAGRATLPGLAPELALTLELREGEHLLLLEHRGLRLDPGEHRTEHRVVGAGCTVEGWTLENDGTPAPGIDLWLLAGTDAQRFAPFQASEVVKRGRSDALGRFVLTDVGAGHWLVGPAPSAGRKHGTQDRSSWIAPIGVPFSVSTEQTRASVDVPCSRGLYISGTVVDPEGRPCEETFVVASSQHDYVTHEARTGSYSIGPLAPGIYLLGASTFHGPFADSEAIEVAAGSSDLVLRLRLGGSLRVHVTAARLNPGNLLVWALNERDPKDSEGVGVDDGGRAEFPGLRPGSYTVSASDAASGFGLLHGVEVGTGAKVSVDLPLDPGCRLRLLVPATIDWTEVQIRRDGRLIFFVPREEGVASLMVPEGMLELVLVRWTSAGEEILQTRTVTPRKGEETVVEFDALPR